MAAGPEAVEEDSLVLRSYRPEDLHLLHEIDTECFAVPFRFSQNDLKRFAEARGAQVVVAAVPDGVVGFIIMHMQQTGRKRWVYVVTLDVREAFRRTGIGGRLMLEAERMAQAEGADSMRLHVFAGNAGAHTFYRQLGYEEQGVVAGFYGAGLHALLLEKRFVRSDGATTSA